MKFKMVWEDAAGEKSPRIGPWHYYRSQAVDAMYSQVRAAAGALEHGTGKSGEFDFNEEEGAATLYGGGLFDDTPLGRYVIEEADDDEA